ncbi:MAG: RAMP superfamily protein [Chloroflexi bacterium]|nr:RAMP superfamily protein [Chloroflexota bacterium]
MTEAVKTLWLKFTLESDATLGRGDGVVGVVDAEVQHDRYGLPYMGGKTLKGLLGAECAEILFALAQIGVSDLDQWQDYAQFLFGGPGSHSDDKSRMRVGNAQLSGDLRDALVAEFRPLQEIANKEERDREWGKKRVANLEALTTIRTQTAMDPKTGAPLEHTLRAMRVLLRKTHFVTRLDFREKPDDRALWLLAACVKAFRRAGTGRHRGRGRLRSELYDVPLYDQATAQTLTSIPVTTNWFQSFEKEVKRESDHISDPAG